MKKLTVIFLFFIQFCGIEVLAQSDTIPNNSYYFDESGSTNKKNMFKLNVLSTIYGKMDISYERRVKSFAYEIGAGLIFPYYLKGFDEILYEKAGAGWEEEIDSQGGASFYGNIKYFLKKDAPKLTYISLGGNLRQYEVPQGVAGTVEAKLAYGYQYIYHEKFVFDVNIGIGIRGKDLTYLDSETEEVIKTAKSYTMISVPIAFKIGYKL